MKWAANQFERVLFRLFHDRTHRLRDLVKSPGSGKVPGFNRKKREKAIGELQKLASACLVKNYAKREFKKLVDKKRKIVCGPALIPDIIIPRNGYNITFSAETIRKISENFLMNGYKDNVTIQHITNINKVFLVESWIIDNPETDKSKALGFDLPQGTWMTSFKIQDENLCIEW